MDSAKTKPLNYALQPLEIPGWVGLTRLAKELALNRGKASADTIEHFFAQGFNEKGLIDLIAVVTAITFTNYIHGATQVAVDFPKAKALEEAIAA